MGGDAISTGLGDTVAISSVGPQSTTAQLAGKVPLEKSKPAQVPEVVTESQQKANFPPEASAVPAEVREKSEVENELLEKVTPAPPTSTDETIKAKETVAEVKQQASETAGIIAGAATTVGGVLLGAAIAAKDKMVESYSNAPPKEEVAQNISNSVQQAKDSIPPAEDIKAKLPPTVVNAINSINETAKTTSIAGMTSSKTETTSQVPSSVVPPAVKHSINESERGPEAAAYSSAIADKAAVEAELLKKTGDGVTDQQPLDKLPEAVKHSIGSSNRGPEAAAYAEPVKEKAAVEEELLRKVPTNQETGEHAPNLKAEAKQEGQQALEKLQATVEKAEQNLGVPTAVGSTQSRDVSPGTVPSHPKPVDHPTVTDGARSAIAPEVSGKPAAAEPVPPKTPAKDTVPAAASQPSQAATTSTAPIAGSSAPAEGRPSTSATGTPASDKKAKRKSFFGKLKQKLKDL
jgi:hypothetical protein